ncbi:MAG: hypothetical protein KAI66_05080 [Lentisphaeria bacterium]|nr:hypothetical protein [Lentisphaeria bacterium]
MKTQPKRKSYTMVAAGLASAAFLSGCSSEKKQWTNAPGTRGFINLDAVKEAFLNYPVVDDFENRLNEVYEGDNLVLVSAEKRGNGFVVMGKEDLNGNKEVDGNNVDDLLFTIVVDRRRATLKGAGINDYYTESFAYDPRPPEERYISSHPHYHHHNSFYYWYRTPMWGGYYTPYPRYTIINTHRTTYRGSPTFGSQIKSNDKFATNQSKTKGKAFRSSANSTSQARKTYVKRSTGDFSRTVKAKKGGSSWGKRAAMKSKTGYSGSKAFARSSGRSGSSFRSSGRGGFRGSSGFSV